MAWTADRNFPTYKLLQQTPYDDSLEKLWNDGIKCFKLPFRSFHVGGRSTPSSRAKWLTIYFLKHAKDFGVFNRDPHPEEVYEKFFFVLHSALHRLAEMGLDAANDKLATSYNARLTIWRFIDPPDNILWLSGKTEEISADAQRRKDKARALSELDAAYKEMKSKIIYLVKDPKDIRLLNKTFVKGCCAVEEEAEWLANPAEQRSQQ